MTGGSAMMAASASAGVPDLALEGPMPSISGAVEWLNSAPLTNDFRVMIDGAAPGGSRGSDVDANGQGTVNEQRLYQLIRQPDAGADHTFEIRFLDPGVQAFAFTFG